MNNNKFFADDYVHLHHDGLLDDRENVEKALCALSGVFSVHFDTDELRHAMCVAYNPEAVSSNTSDETASGLYATHIACLNSSVSK